MTDDTEKKDQDGFDIPDASFSDLLGRQSVRATFRLSERAIDAIAIVAGHLGIKKKSLFDHLMDDATTLHAIAKNLSALKFQNHPRVQKTFVLSRRTLNSLEQISRTFDTPRDVLVEYSIQRLESIIKAEREKHELRKSLIGEVEVHVKQTGALLEKARTLLGEEDAVCRSMERLLESGIHTFHEIKDVLDKGKVIEEF
jgi:hypothetical protein